MDTTTKILTFTAVMYILYYYYKNWKAYNTAQLQMTWPRKYSPCPDYWVKTKDGKCKNMFNLGKCPSENGPKGVRVIPQGEVDFRSDLYKGKSGHANKCRWSHRCKSSWEGIDSLCA